MSSEWREVILSEVIEIIGGGTPKTSTDEYWNGDIPWLSVVDFNDSGRFVFNAEKTITEDGLNNSSTKILDKGDIIISARGTVGALAQLGKPMAFNQSCYGLRGKNGQTLNDYLYYLLVNTVNNLKRIAHGGVFDTITRGTFDNISVRIPSIEKQNKIASILGAFDQKIYLNQQTNQTLEAMAQAIFKSWFVDFDPVRAKIEATSAGRDPNRAAMAAIAGISLEQDWDEIEAALDQKLARMSEAQQLQLTHTAELFPEELVESEIGLVPKGWGVKKLGNVSELNPESISTDFEGEIEYINISGVNDGVINEIEIHDFKEAPSRARRKVKHGDMIWSNVRPNLKAYSLILNPSLNLIASTGFTVIRPKQLPASYIYNHCISEEFISFLVNSTEGSAYPAVKVADFKRSEIVFPSNNLANLFHELVWDNFERIDALKKENKSLSELRDTLLPKLISGEIKLN